MLNAATATEAPSGEEAPRKIMQTCMEIGIGAQTIVTLAGQAIENFDIENHQGYDLAHSVELIAKDMKRRADLVYESLDGGPIGLALAHNGAGDADTHQAIKDILRERIKGWKAYTLVPEEDKERYAKAEAAFHKGDDAAVKAIDRLTGGKSLDAALAGLIIAKGPSIGFDVIHHGTSGICDRLESQAAAAGLDWFGLREMYDEYLADYAKPKPGHIRG